MSYNSGIIGLAISNSRLLAQSLSELYSTQSCYQYLYHTYTNWKYGEGVFDALREKCSRRRKLTKKNNPHKAWVKESAKTQTKTKPNAPRDPRQPLKGKKIDHSFNTCWSLWAKFWGGNMGKGAPGVGHNCWILFHTWYMYIWILLDHVMTTQPISVSVSVGEAAA